MKRLVIFLIAVASLAGCGPKRHPVPVDLVEQAQIPGFAGIRVFGDQVPQMFGKDIAARFTQRISRGDNEISVLALSGGGARGAFGAGLLCG